MSPMVVRVEPVSLSSVVSMMPPLLSVSHTQLRTTMIILTIYAAKFSGYQYGGRPLGLTYVRYSNQQPAMDPMQGQEQTSMPMGLTQDQIM